MKPESKMIDGALYFKNFMVQKESENFFGVYEHSWNRKYGEVITSGSSMESASKKAKMLQIGYDICKDNMASDARERLLDGPW